MQEDIAALKKGQAPAGFQIEKQSEKEIKAPALPAQLVKPVGPTAPFSHVELGRLEKSKPLASGTTPAPLWPSRSEQKATGTPPVGLGQEKPAIGIPSASGIMNRLANLGSRKIMLWGGIGILAIVAVVFIFVLGGSEPEVVFSPTPLATRTPTPTTPAIENTFDLYSTINISVGPSIFEQLLAAIDKESPAPGQAGLYKIVDPQSNQPYSFVSFMSSALVTLPEELKSFVAGNNIYLSLMKQPDGNFNYGIAVKLSADLGIAPALARWEATISSDIKTLFGLDTDKAASIDFLDNVYQGVPVRYRNFPDPLKTIDYAVITSANGDKYLVFVNSRAHMYIFVDNLK